VLTADTSDRAPRRNARNLLELELELPDKSSRNLLRSLHDQLRAAILDGRFAAGLQLPASRALADRLGLSRNTVVAAYDLLLSEGYIVTHPGSGTFVAEVARIKKPREVISETDERLSPRWRDAQPIALVRRTNIDFDFRLGAPDASQFPFEIWRRLHNRSLREVARSQPVYGNPAGEPALREAIAAHVSFTRAVACDAEGIVVTAGAQQAFDLLARVLVTAGKTIVAVEEPGYRSARATFAAAGAIIKPVRVDSEGIVVADIPSDAKIVCVTPSHQFPLGVPMSPARRAALLSFASQHDAVLIEDDYDGEFRFEGRPLDALQTLDDRDSVFYIGTFSKSMFPGLRQGFLVAPQWAVKALSRARQLSDWHGSSIDQRTLAAFIIEGHLARHVRRMRKVYEQRRLALREALERHCRSELVPFPSYAGLHLATRIVSDKDPAAIVARAAELGVAVDSCARYATSSNSPRGLVFGYGLIKDSRIDAAARRVAQAINDVPVLERLAAEA
jgi:GntR family transcriptional regulator/MocR family aminotransferase